MRDLFRQLKYLPGWRTSRKLVVIESDDWGSIRMPSLDSFKKLKEHGLDMTSGDMSRYNSNDTLASKEDLSALFEVLNRYTDKNGNSAVFTAVNVVANPDFDKILASGFSEYSYEPFTDTLEKYYGDNSSFLLWQEGKNLGIFMPQFHGREHLNVPVWMRNLHDNDVETRLAFDHGFWGFKKQSSTQKMPKYQAAFDFGNKRELEIHASVITDGLELFHKIHGFRAEYFVPPNALIHNSLNEASSKAGIKFRSASMIQKEPKGNAEYRKVHHYLGQKNRFGQRYIIRNALFEPGSKEKSDWADSCLRDIGHAFSWKKPAIISSHRVNYIGSLNKSNRDHGLQQLDTLLKTIVKKWPEVEFISTMQLGALMNN
jgi:hypothetical protein